MTVGELLEELTICDQSTDARYPDGSGGEDLFHLNSIIDGHGKVLDMEVEQIRVHPGSMFLTLKGSTEEGGESA